MDYTAREAFARWAADQPLSPGHQRALRDTGFAVQHTDGTFVLTDTGRAALAEARQGHAPHVPIYALLKDAGIPLDSHESDLYALATPAAEAIVRASGWSYTTFRSQLDGKRWYDIAFAYLPWWEARQTTTPRQEG